MNCFSCFQCHGRTEEDASPNAEHDHKKQKAGGSAKTKKDHIEHGDISSQHYTFRELASATKNFRQECLLGEGGFGRVYKGTLPDTGQVVAVKQLDRHGLQGNQEFLAEVMAMSQLHHENLVKLVGYCADGDQRLLVHEYLSGGSLEDHLFDIGVDKRPLDWVTRMRIAFGAAQGLEYLHDKADPPVIYRDLKSSNILMDSDYNPKLSDFGLAKLGPSNDKMHVSSRVMGTYGYCAPEYARTGQLTVKSDIYSFGVVLLELITGRKAIDNKRPTHEQNLVTWAQPKFRDPKSFPDMADPVLECRFPEKGLNQAVAIAAMCLQEEASVRPLIGDVVATLGFLMVVPPEPVPAPISESLPSQIKKEGTDKKCPDSGDESDTDSHSSGDSDAGEGRRLKKGHKDAFHDEEGKYSSSSDDEEEVDFQNFVAEEKDYDSAGSSSMISFSLGGSLLSRDKSSTSCLQSVSANRQVSMAFSEKSVSSRHGMSKEWSRKSSRRSKGESGWLSPRGSISSSNHRSSYSSHDEIDLITPKGSICSSGRKSSKKSHFGSTTLSSRDRSGVFGRGSSVKSRGGNDSSPRSSIEQGHSHYFGHDATEGSKGSSSEEEEEESHE